MDESLSEQQICVSELIFCIIGIGTGGEAGWATAPPPIFCYVLKSLQLSKTDI